MAVLVVVAVVAVTRPIHLHAEGHLPLDVGAPRRRRRPRHRLEEAPRDALEAARDAVAVLVAAARRREVEQLEEEVDLREWWRSGGDEVVGEVVVVVVEAVRQVVVVVVVMEGWGNNRTFGWRRYKISSAMIISSSHLGRRIDLPRSECGRVITGRMNGCDSCGVELGRSGSDLRRWRPVDALMMWTQRRNRWTM